MEKFKIRCSSIDSITGGVIGLTEAQKKEVERLELIPKTKVGLTEKQSEALDKLSANEKRTSAQEDKMNEMILKRDSFKELTTNQQSLLEELIDKRDNPVLPEGLKTVCKKWYKTQLTGKKGKFQKNKYTEKGNVQEDLGIDLIAEYMDYGMLIKNEDFYGDDPDIQGTPDVLPEDRVIDNKSSWDIDTFPLFETRITNNAYWWQLQGYMALTGKTKATLAYTLVDTPENLIDAQAWQECKSLGLEELDAVIYESVRSELIFSDLPLKLRVKTFDIDRDDEAIKLVRERVKMCRDYINNELVPMME